MVVGDRCGRRLESLARLHGDGNQGQAWSVGEWGVIKDRRGGWGSEGIAGDDIGGSSLLNRLQEESGERLK